MGRNLADGNAIKTDYSVGGIWKLRLTPSDSIGSTGDVLTNVGGSLQFQAPAVPTSNATINFQRFNSSGTWTKPTGLNALSPVLIRLWHGGGSGELGTNGGGGGGGGYTDLWTTLGALGATETVTVGAGGAARVGSSAPGAAGGLSAFGAFSNGQGGGGGNNSGGDGGGPLTAPLGRIYHDIATPAYHGQGGTSATIPGQSGVWHGGGGGSNTGTSGRFNAGSSVYGGGGGSGTNGSTAGTAGTSVNAGNGGTAGANGTSGQAGTQPAGGGGAAENTGGASSGAGGAGRVDVIVFGFPA